MGRRMVDVKYRSILLELGADREFRLRSLSRFGHRRYAKSVRRFRGGAISRCDCAFPFEELAP